MADGDGELFKLRLDGPGIAVSKNVDRGTALSVIRVLMGDTGTTVRDPSTDPSETIGKVPLSLREYLDSVGARTKAAQIVAISAYLLDFSKEKDVSRDEIKAMFADASEPMPRNFARDFGKVLKVGWMAPAHGSKSRYYVTQSGRAALKKGIKI
jgi:hypothetical protein